MRWSFSLSPPTETEGSVIVRRHIARTFGKTAVIVAWLWRSLLPAEAATVTVDCDAGRTIGGALGGLKAGDVLAVTGTCREHVVIPAEVARIILDGAAFIWTRAVSGASSTTRYKTTEASGSGA